MHTRTAIALLAAACATSTASDGLRIATWNISNYSGGRIADLQTSFYAEFQGRSMSPDAVLLQEMLSAAAVSQIVTALNSAPNSPGDWAAAPFINGPDTDNGFVYRTSKLELLDTIVVSRGGPSPNHPRDVNRYDVRLVGYESEPATLSLYSSHMKAGSGSSDQARRLVEAQAIRDDTDALPADRVFVLGGDFNIQSSSQAAYIELTISAGQGRFRDPIATPGNWNNNGTYRYVHTQDPVGAGGMDDRHDQILVGSNLTNGDAADYIGAPTTPYSTTTWDDPNHSYRSWGNDGSSFNTVLRSTGNEMVGPAIADALKRVCAGGGHLPVFLDLRVPAEAAATDIIDFGIVTAGVETALPLAVSNDGNVALWGPAGIDTLDYALSTAQPFDAPQGPFTDEPGGQAGEHPVTILTPQAGYYEGVVFISTNAPDTPLIQVPVRANVLDACRPDWNQDGSINALDFFAYLNDWSADNPHADVDWNGDVDVLDFLTFLNLWNAGC